MFLSAVDLYWENVDFYRFASIFLYALLGVCLIAAITLWSLYAVKRVEKLRAIAKVLTMATLITLFVLSMILIENWGDAIRTKDENGVKHWPWYWHFTKYTVIVVGLVVCAVIWGLLKTPTPTRATQELTMAAVCIALSYALSYIKLFSLPMGGSITAASVLPLAVYCFYFGFKRGVGATAVYSVLQMLQEPVVYAFGQVLLDYIIPFTAIAMVGLISAKNKKLGKWGIFIGLVLYAVVRYFCHFLSGALYFGIWMPENFDNVWIYSLAYNSFVFVDTLIAAVVGLILMATKDFPRLMSRYVAKAEALSARRSAQQATDSVGADVVDQASEEGSTQESTDASQTR